MRKYLILIPILVLAVAASFFIYRSSYSLDKYYEGIDYSCSADADCDIKDVHNCCGYFPKCVNKNAKTDPDYVRKACGEGLASVCGFPAIDGCKCAEKKCSGTFQGD